MDISPYRISFHFLCQKDAQNLIFCIKLESSFGQKCHGVYQEMLIYATQSSSIHPHASEEGYEILKQ